MGSKPAFRHPFISSLLLLLLTAVPAAAVTISVTSLADDGSGGCTLRDAVAAANTNAPVGGCPAGAAGRDTISFTVAGTVQLASLITITEGVDIEGLRESGNSARRIRTTIKPAPGDLIFIFSSPGQDQDSTLRDLNLVGPDSGDGQGVTLWTGDGLYLFNCVLKGFRSTYGAAIFNFGGSVWIQQSVLSGNSATGGGSLGPHGGAIYNTGYLSLANCTVSGNYAEKQGGGVFSSGPADILNCTFSGNRAGAFGGALSFTGTVSIKTILNSILWGNSAPENPEIDPMGSAPVVANSDVAGAAPWPGTGNILATPLFVMPRPAGEAPTAAGDYHLKHTSPCVDAGLDPGISTDIDMDLRARDGGYDIGSDEAGPPFNDSFEYGKAIPAPWTGANLTPDDRKVKDQHHSGGASFRFTGGNADKYLKQKLPLAGHRNNQIRLSGWSRTAGSSTAGGAYRLEARVYYDDGSVGLIAAPFAAGTHAWKEALATLSAPRDFNRIVLLLRYGNQTGAAWFDDVKVQAIPY